MTRKLALVAALLVALGTISAGIAIAANRAQSAATEDEGTDTEREGADTEETLTGSPAERAAAAALEATGGGTVLEVEAADDPGAAYEVEVRGDDGSVSEVLLDEDYRVLEVLAGD
jgi:uncharacterized membrane protein YkoI